MRKICVLIREISELCCKTCKFICAVFYSSSYTSEHCPCMTMDQLEILLFETRIKDLVLWESIFFHFYARMPVRLCTFWHSWTCGIGLELHISTTKTYIQKGHCDFPSLQWHERALYELQISEKNPGKKSTYQTIVVNIASSRSALENLCFSSRALENSHSSNSIC